MNTTDLMNKVRGLMMDEGLDTEDDLLLLKICTICLQIMKSLD
jgi:hypothetical protein